MTAGGAFGRPRVRPGRPYPLGAVWDGAGVNFALFSAHAERVELCLFDPRGQREIERITLPDYTEQVWHGYVDGIRPGQLYGYRVYGAWDPAHGHRFNHHKLLIDPYARAISGELRWHDSLFGHRVGKGDLVFDRRDSARFMPKSVVVDPAATWGDDRRPGHEWTDLVCYEAHVKGLTMLRGDVPERLRGTFLGLAQPGVIEHLTKLGVTAIELMPIHAFADEHPLVERGLVNYWGYNSMAFFAPAPRYGLEDPLQEFRSLVHRLHEAGIEVILDVVYNHTAEGNHLGPTLSFKGIDNASYYRLVPGDERHYENYTGTGNTVNLRHPRVLQLVMDSLRYWVTEMRVDGFRFDLAPVLARERDFFDPGSGFLDAVRQDPVLSQVKLIAEPWDLGHDGYRQGAFPPGWSEWNGKFRDTVRRFWRGDGGLIGDLASRLTGSSDLFGWGGRRPKSSINFITAHDGFTLRDLVSYDRKHNDANGEQNRDGSDSNWSWNCGHEGPTEDPQILELRARQQRNLLTTLFLSQGVPILLAGDEIGNSQGGNNNAYCQDNPIGWTDWPNADQALLDFTRRLIAFRREHPVFRRPRFFEGRVIGPSGLKDITWITPEGREMEHGDWHLPYTRSLAFIINGEAVAAEGETDDDSFMMMINSGDQAIDYVLPQQSFGPAWEVAIDTARPTGPGGLYGAGAVFSLTGRSLVVLARRGLPAGRET